MDWPGERLEQDQHPGQDAGNAHPHEKSAGHHQFQGMGPGFVPANLVTAYCLDQGWSALDEPEADSIENALVAAGRCFMSALTLFECHTVLWGRLGARGLYELGRLTADPLCVSFHVAAPVPRRDCRRRPYS